MAFLGQCAGLGPKECYHSASNNSKLCFSCQIKKLKIEIKRLQDVISDKGCPACERHKAMMIDQSKVIRQLKAENEKYKNGLKELSLYDKRPLKQGEYIGTCYDYLAFNIDKLIADVQALDGKGGEAELYYKAEIAHWFNNDVICTSQAELCYKAEIAQRLAGYEQLQAENEKLEGNYEKLATWFNRHYIATCNDAYCVNVAYRVKDDCGECATQALAKILALDGKGGE